MGERDLTAVQRFLTLAVQRRAPIDDARDPDVSALVAPSARGMTPAQRLEVYRDMFWQRHLRSLAEDYPTLTWVLGGPEAFEALAVDFLLACPPKTWDLQRLGGALPAFVARHPRLANDAAARDAARLDWAFMEIFDAPDASPFDPRVLASTPEDAWPGAKVALLPALQLLMVRSGLLEVRDALKASAEAPPLPTPASQTHAVIWRDAACFPRSLAIEGSAYGLLTRLSRGEALGPSCEAVAVEHGVEADVEARVGPWFQDWVQRGWVSQVIAGYAA